MMVFPEHIRLSAVALIALDIKFLLGDFPNQPAPTMNFGRVLGTGCIGHSTIFRTVVAVGSGTPVDFTLTGPAYNAMAGAHRHHEEPVHHCADRYRPFRFPNLFHWHCSIC